MDIRIRFSKNAALTLATASKLSGETLSGFIYKAAMERASQHETGRTRQALGAAMTTTLREAGFPTRLITQLGYELKLERDVTIADYAAMSDRELELLPQVGPVSLAKAKMIMAIMFGGI